MSHLYVSDTVSTREPFAGNSRTFPTKARLLAVRSTAGLAIVVNLSRSIGSESVDEKAHFHDAHAEMSGNLPAAC